MRKRVILSTLLLLTGFIILPGSSIGKDNVGKPAVADGSPLPPFPPNPPTPSDHEHVCGLTLA
jgi:hypothetical protein